MPRPWRKGVTLVFWYASEASEHKLTKRTVKVERYLTLADGVPGVFARPPTAMSLGNTASAKCFSSRLINSFVVLCDLTAL